MKRLVIEIPNEFCIHFNNDNFKDSFERIKCDLIDNGVMAGLYEVELIDMLIGAFQSADYLEE